MQGSSRALPAAVGLMLICLLGGFFGCNSDSRGESASQRLAAADHATDGAFRNLGKRSAFDYGSVQPEERASVPSTRRR